MAARHATASEVLTFAPGLTSLDTDIFTTLVDLAATMVSVECWGDKASFAHLLLAAHLGTEALDAGSGGASGPVTSMQIDKIKVTYGAGSSSAADASLASTTYGRQYAALRRTLMVLPLTGRVLA